jgi:hypothetical protein
MRLICNIRDLSYRSNFKARRLHRYTDQFILLAALFYDAMLSLYCRTLYC